MTRSIFCLCHRFNIFPSIFLVGFRFSMTITIYNTTSVLREGLNLLRVTLTCSISSQAAIKMTKRKNQITAMVFLFIISRCLTLHKCAMPHRYNNTCKIIMLVSFADWSRIETLFGGFQAFSGTKNKDNDDDSINEIELLYCTYNGCMPR